VNVVSFESVFAWSQTLKHTLIRTYK